MQWRREYNPFHNALDTSKIPSIKPWSNSSQSGNEDKRRGKNLNYLYFFFFLVAVVTMERQQLTLPRKDINILAQLLDQGPTLKSMLMKK